MPEIPGQSVPATRPRAHLHARLLAIQIQRGLTLVRRLEAREDETVAHDYQAWCEHNERLLRLLIASHEVWESYLRTICSSYGRRTPPSAGLIEAVQTEMRDLASVADKLGLSQTEPEASIPAASSGELPADKVLIVYGRNEEAKEKVARFLMKLQLEPILLDEQAARGRTLIEKLETQWPIAFVVVLLTGDDVGGLAPEPRTLRPRVRQNVVFELGFSIAKLNRERVCALYEEGVELPSDFHGVEYKPLDAAGAWKAKLAKELHEAGLRFDPLRILDA